MVAGSGERPRLPSEGLDVTVTSADGPRSTVPDPPFHDAAPLLAVTLEAMPGGDGRARLPFLYVDLDGLPEAAAVVRGDRRPGTVLEKAVTLFVHSSGNGYVGVTVTEHDVAPAAGPGVCSGSGPRVLRVAVDPVRHAAGLAAAVRGGRLVMAHHWVSAVGDRHRSLLPVDVDRRMLERVVRAALTHPRRVRVALRDGPRRPGA
ncbi:hypothetical protein [Streptomyces sp. UH6]|uniref:hypothetical protein n=1 Tax=Streptomyces sp. UH6 TaxID=2748379 RepID=UPI0015D4E290|nr:hypothetical protein [Streptomyces sp. UH6]NYV73671.1 hypothetical protein [Streptomyces sp. UH6]